MNPKIKIILIISILFNVLLIGFVAGQFSSKAMHKFHGKNFKDREEKMISLLDEKNQQIAREFLKNLHEKHKASFAGVKESVEALKAVVKAENFDKEKFISEMAKIDELFVKSKKESSTEIADFLSKLSQKERLALADEFSKRPLFSHNKDR
jgi:uncharacterized membrane protein